MNPRVHIEFNVAEMAWYAYDTDGSIIARRWTLDRLEEFLARHGYTW